MEDSDERCQVCNYATIREDHDHNNTPLHIFNFQLWAWKKYKKALIKNRHGIEIEIKHVQRENCHCLYKESRHGNHTLKITPDQFSSHNNLVSFQCEIKNISNANIMITAAKLIHPINLFRFTDEYLSNRRFVKLRPRAVYKCYVEYECWPLTIGSLKNSLAINFQTEGDNCNHFTIAKTFCVHITEFIDDQVVEDSPFREEEWSNVNIIPPTQHTKYVNKYPIPEDFETALRMGLREHPGMDMGTHSAILMLKAQMRPGYVTEYNYKEFFHNVLWLEEIGCNLMLRKYNMSKIFVQINHNTLELTVPGLAEKRPSVIVGDLIDIRVHEDHTGYRGVITKVNDKTVEISYINQELIDVLRDSEYELDVRFVLGRLSLERQHEGVDRVYLADMIKYLCPGTPQVSVQNLRQIPEIEFYNRSIYYNQEQRTAVNNIVYNTSRNYPYIVYGPPGTGKTVTIVEAILQLKRRTNKRILICAPANAACDMITAKLMTHCNRSELIRVHSESVDRSIISDSLREYSNFEEGIIVKTSPEKLKTYRIVVTTLILIGRYSDRYQPDVVFVDEAAQAAEPEVDIAIGFLNDSKHFVLAGDPKQLGPTCASKVSEKYHYGKSLLERLMDTDLYKTYNPNYITMLKQNFRSHPLILRIPNQLFYENQLVALSATAMIDDVSKHFVLNERLASNTRKGGVKRPKGQPIEFYGVISRERREGRSPSFYNPDEIQVVMKYVNALLTSSRYEVAQDDIGIITPYIRQVYKIRDRLRKLNYDDVQVGTTETFQGREKRIIIISTVRAQHSLLKFDRKYNLGFVRHDQRFNVALTRAISKLIIVGCPHVLGTDAKWRTFIELCEELDAYFGAPYVRRTNEVITSVSNNLRSINARDSQYDHNNQNNRR